MSDQDSQSFDLNPEKIASFERMMGVSAKICTDVGLDRFFLLKMSEIDDWGFILKIHSLLDHAIALTIMDTCFNKFRLSTDGQSEIEKICSNMNFEGKLSKIQFLKIFNLASERTLRFLKNINIVRNRYSHDIKNIDLKILDIIKVCNLQGKGCDSLLTMDASKYLLPEDSQQVKFFISLSAAFAIWEIREFSKPPPTLLG